MDESSEEMETNGLSSTFVKTVEASLSHPRRKNNNFPFFLIIQRISSRHFSLTQSLPAFRVFSLHQNHYFSVSRHPPRTPKCQNGDGGKHITDEECEANKERINGNSNKSRRRFCGLENSARFFSIGRKFSPSRTLEEPFSR